MPNLTLKEIEKRLNETLGGFLVLQEDAILSYGKHQDGVNFRAVILVNGERLNEYHGDIKGLMAIVSKYRRKTRKTKVDGAKTA